jgi:hypothetical protein
MKEGGQSDRLLSLVHALVHAVSHRTMHRMHPPHPRMVHAGVAIPVPGLIAADVGVAGSVVLTVRVRVELSAVPGVRNNPLR